MNYANMKIYFDGGHYVGIPQGAFPSGKGCKRRAVKPMKQQSTADVTPPETPKERFETAYKESQSLPKRERKAHIKSALKDDFKDKAELNAFVEKHTERMNTNAIKRKVRLMRKLRLQEWNFFVTFTYSNELHTEETFRKKLSNTLKHLVARNGWKIRRSMGTRRRYEQTTFSRYFLYPRRQNDRKTRRSKRLRHAKPPYANDIPKHAFSETIRT